MAILNAAPCTDPSKLSSINFNLLPVSIGEVWSATDKLGPDGYNYCFTIIDGNDEPTSFFSAQTEYTNCYECLMANNTIVRVLNCLDGTTSFILGYFNFLIPPALGDVFFGELTMDNQPFNSCWEIVEIYQATLTDYNKALPTFASSPPIISFYNGCTECITGATIPYDVERCTDKTTDCVGLVNGNSLIGYIISYSDGINEYCGIVRQSNTGGCAIEYNYINTYGNQDSDCNLCLSTENIKLVLENCLIPNETEVVWASSLFNIGDSSSLSTSLGCYTVSGETTNPVTINNFLNFDPQPNCQTCIECNGYTIGYVICGVPDPAGMLSTSYQYIQIGEFFNHPLHGCCEVISLEQGDFGGDYIYNFETFSSCLDCELNSDRVLYEATACTSATTYVFNVSVPSTANLGDTYQLSWGNIPFICVTLTGPVFEGNQTGYYFSTDVQITCEECSSINIGVRAINCSTGQYSVFNLTQEDYVRHYYSKPREFYVFKTNGECYFIANPCPQIPTGTTAIITNYYDICYDCTPDNPEPPRSAGTESTICVICYDVLSGETVTVVSPPHPVWTDSRGIAVTQLNAITLGGMNGLNN